MQALARLEGEWLGAGGFGSCFKVVDPLRGKLVVKTIYDSALSVLLTEAINLQQLQGPGVQRLFGACVETCQLVTHYAGHTADQYFQVCHPLADIASVFLQVTLALQEIIRKGFTHNDIKGSNVCVATPGTGPVATVIDLGLARRLGTRGLYGGGLSVMRLPWVAPEIVRDKRPTSEASDAFSLAAMMQRVLGLARGCPYPPTQAALALWLHDALSPDPEERPALEELVEMLEVLLEAVKSAHPPPAKGTSGQTRKRR
ncbi:uncharacterized protein LOC127003632 [Eriocheir sinensis]|uniref:uncharacterized protein LOC127003632 n=1 Tax=Eriocheir sinensis TaxID=95602 RepID=UPI0021C8FAC1|nr:uncharacterized protein LOC127003632 [Eriocheir sinensis]